MLNVKSMAFDKLLIARSKIDTEIEMRARERAVKIDRSDEAG